MFYTDPNKVRKAKEFQFVVLSCISSFILPFSPFLSLESSNLLFQSLVQISHHVSQNVFVQKHLKCRRHTTRKFHLFRSLSWRIIFQLF